MKIVDLMISKFLLLVRLADVTILKKLSLHLAYTLLL